jgi:hypothetical protein
MLCVALASSHAPPASLFREAAEVDLKLFKDDPSAASAPEVGSMSPLQRLASSLSNLGTLLQVAAARRCPLHLTPPLSRLAATLRQQQRSSAQLGRIRYWRRSCSIVFGIPHDSRSEKSGRAGATWARHTGWTADGTMLCRRA